jgi:hypothetical protein
MKLSEIAKQLKALTVHTSERLKENVVLRSAIAKQAGALLDAISEHKQAA